MDQGSQPTRATLCRHPASGWRKWALPLGGRVATVAPSDRPGQGLGCLVTGGKLTPPSQNLTWAGGFKP
eukprot:2828126-Lingulodinium_polyedra.AAC.1